jgi:hypothetical protein
MTSTIEHRKVKQIQWIQVILETDAYYYSSYMDMIDTIHSIYNSGHFPSNVTIQILWDGDKTRDTVYHKFDSSGSQITKKEKTINLSERVSSYVNMCIEDMPYATVRIFSFYVHGNIWFLRHLGKIITFRDIFSKIKYPVDIINLESCYTASIEMCLETSNKARYLIASEASHAKCSMLNTHCLQHLSKYNNPDSVRDLAIFMADCFIHRVNYFSYRDKVLLDLACDSSIIDLEQFKQLYSTFCQAKLNQQSDEVYRKSKTQPKRSPSYLGYDVFSVISKCQGEAQNQSKCIRQFSNVVIYYQQSKWLREKKWHTRYHGLCWSPAPFDSEHGWTYKYSTAFQDIDKLTIYSRDL